MADSKIFGFVLGKSSFKQALAVVRLERMDRKNCPLDWGSQLDGQRAEMKRIHSKLKGLGIAEPVFDSYYLEAERRYKAAS